MRVIEVKSCGHCPYCGWSEVARKHRCFHPFRKAPVVEKCELSGEFPKFCPLKEAKDG